MLKELLISEVRLKILKLLLLNPNKSYHVRAIVRAVGAEINAVRRELENLNSINLLRKRQSSNRLYYSVDTSHPFYSEVLALLGKEDGLGGLILKNLKNLGDIEYAVLSKAYLRGRQPSPLDVDLFIVGEIRMDVMESLIRGYQDKSGREINYSVMNSEEFRNRKRVNDQFVLRILTRSRTMLVGDEEKFSAVI